MLSERVVVELESEHVKQACALHATVVILMCMEKKETNVVCELGCLHMEHPLVSIH